MKKISEKLNFLTGIAHGCLILTVIVGISLMLAGCGNTITGLGKDISTVGEKVTVWQNTPSEKEEVDVKKNETK